MNDHSNDTLISRRDFVLASTTLASISWLNIQSAFAAESVPQTVKELWADFDPRKDPLEIEVIREWREDNAIFRHVRFVIGTFKGKPARLAAIYGFPLETTGKVPGVLHIHGGGQRAFLSEVKLLVARGYAGLSVNWGGSGTGNPPFNAVEGAQPDDPNTDWGNVDPTQLNVPGYESMQPGPKQFFEDREHPKNNNWYLLTLACRRALTFLERQPEVNSDRLGVHGFSMGGNLTMYVAGTDDRVKVAIPGVGGQGWRWEPHVFTGGNARPQMQIKGDVDLFRRTLSFESYAPTIHCPVLHRSGTNDFHGRMDDVYRTNALIPNQPVRYCFSPHLNHRLIPEVEVAMPLWLDQWLKDGPALPETPRIELSLKNTDHIPALRVINARHAWPIARCEIYYSIDSDPLSRFWRSADLVRDGDIFTAKLALHSLDTPLFAFANVYHELPHPVSLNQLRGYREPVRQICLSSLIHCVTSQDLRDANIVATVSPSTLIDDFSHGMRDWYQLNVGNNTHLQSWTRKVTDPLWKGIDGSRLKLTLRMPQTNSLSLVLHQNEWRNYRGPKRTFICRREIAGSDNVQTISFGLSDFISPEGPLLSWQEIDQLGICAYFAERTKDSEAAPLWNGVGATLVKLEWEVT
jgi:hypothetical protein